MQGADVRKIVVLATGGTIAGQSARSGDHVGYQAGTLGVQQMLAAVLGEPPARSDAYPSAHGYAVHAVQVAQIDSKDMTWAVWCQLLEHCADALADPLTSGVVITHGTDTLEETAYWLHRVLGPKRPVVLVSAMRPASALSADGPQNLLDALLVAACGESAGLGGVLAIAAGTVHTAQAVFKAHPYRMDAFSSGDSGPVAYVEQERLRVVRAAAGSGGGGDAATAARPERAELSRAMALHGDQGPWVAMVHSGADARAAEVDVWVRAGVQGLVIVGTGNATVHQSLWPALERAHQAGIVMRRTSRCLLGPVVSVHASGEAAGGLDLWCPVSALSAPKLRVALQLSLAMGLALP